MISHDEPAGLSASRAAVEPSVPGIDEFNFERFDSFQLFDDLPEFSDLPSALTQQFSPSLKFGLGSRRPSLLADYPNPADWSHPAPTHSAGLHPAFASSLALRAPASLPAPALAAPAANPRPLPARASRVKKPVARDDDFVADAGSGSDSDNSSDTSDFQEDDDDEEAGPASTRMPRGKAKVNLNSETFLDHADLSAPLTTIVDTAEERKLVQKLSALQAKMNEEAKRLKQLVSSDRKRKRNRMASQISRLRKKLLVFELQRRYIDTVEENKGLRAENDALKQRLDDLQRRGLI
jgi:hypothetical protein